MKVIKLSVKAKESIVLLKKRIVFSKFIDAFKIVKCTLLKIESIEDILMF